MSDKTQEVGLQERPTYKSFNLTQRVRGKKVIGEKQELDLGVLFRVRDVCIWINKKQGSCLGINEEHKGCEAIKGTGRCGLFDSVIELVQSIHASFPPLSSPRPNSSYSNSLHWLSCNSVRHDSEQCLSHCDHRKRLIDISEFSLGDYGGINVR